MEVSFPKGWWKMTKGHQEMSYILLFTINISNHEPKYPSWILRYISNHIPIQVDEQPESLNPIMNITINFHRMVINFESHPACCEDFSVDSFWDKNSWQLVVVFSKSHNFEGMFYRNDHYPKKSNTEGLGQFLYHPFLRKGSSPKFPYGGFPKAPRFWSEKVTPTKWSVSKWPSGCFSTVVGGTRKVTNQRAEMRLLGVLKFLFWGP